MLRIVARSFPSETRATCSRGGFVEWLALPLPFDGCTQFDAALREGICIAPGDIFSTSNRYRSCTA